MLIGRRLFGTLNSSDNVYEYTLKNANGLEVSCLDYGCAVTKIMTPDRGGNFENIVLGFQDLAAYEKNPIFAGVVVGRVAGRIKGAKFELDGKTHILTCNEGENQLHGGMKGFHKVLWNAEIIDQEKETTLQFSYTSADGEEGYPGTLTTKVTYTLTNNNELLICYQGQSDKTTLFNPTNHTYFNLSGNLKRDICQHSLKMQSSTFLELSEQLLPTGRVLDVKETAFDFRKGQKLMVGIISNDVQNKIAGQGYDHAFVLDSNNSGEIVLHEEESGRSLVIETDAAGLVLYTGNHIPNELDFYEKKSERYMGICIETQLPPDAIHHPNFPSCVLEKDQIFITKTKYTFGLSAN
ncbi:MAG: aldose epimerase family protein [Negativicutes bacterium]